MGIKGIYAELGPGKRVSLAKLAAERLETTGRPLRLAIDISIWQFQIQAARGGTNPAERTLFYRISRLLSHGIEPICVFDGPHKPAFKRNKRSNRVTTATDASAKKLLRIFGLSYHDAPGEAEAECALLQQNGLVDAVLSEDVDTIMFGCKKTLRSWSADTKSGKTPTHVSMYDVCDENFRASGLDREGLVLVALMSGGDYIPEGIPGCGPKVASEAARAGFGKSVCKLKRADQEGLRRWKESLVHELKTNESGFFKKRHIALTIPDEFPNLHVLRYYTHPVVSGPDRIGRLKNGFPKSPIDMPAMRQFVNETFDWKYRLGAEKLVRVLAPTLVVQQLMGSDAVNHKSMVPKFDGDGKADMVQRITLRRKHHSTDEISELRVQYVPANVAGLDLSAEVEEAVTFSRGGLALNSDDEFDEAEGQEITTKTAKKRFDPLSLDSIWVPEVVVRMGARNKIEEWEEGERKRLEKKARPTAGRRNARAKAPEAPNGTLDNWVQLSQLSSRDKRVPGAQDARDDVAEAGARRKPPPKTHDSKKRHSTAPHANINPWTVAGSQNALRTTKAMASSSFSSTTAEPIIISSSPPPRSSSPSAKLPPPQPVTKASPAPVPTTPRGRLPTDPLDTPSWLKSSPESSPNNIPVRAKRPAPVARQTMLHSYMSSPAGQLPPERRQEAEAEAEPPPVQKAPGRRKAPPTPLWRISKKRDGSTSKASSVDASTLPSKKTQNPKGVLDWSDIDSDSDFPVDTLAPLPSTTRCQAGRPESMTVPVIDLTSDD